MDTRRLYDDDFYSWSEQQASVLRRMADRRGQIPNDLDLENVAEEIEGLGRSHKDSAESLIRLILVHLVKLTAAPDASAVNHWRGEIVSFHIDLLSKATPTIWNGVDLDRLWRLAKRQARASLSAEEAESPTSAIWDVEACPLDLRSFKDDEFKLTDALARLARAAGSS